MIRINGSATEMLAYLTYYPGTNLVHTATDAAGQTTTFTYNANSQVETITNPKLEVTTRHYDSLGRLESIDGPLPGTNDSVSFGYDSVVLTRVSSVTAPGNYTITYEHDALDRLTKTTYPDTTFEQIIYNRMDAEWIRDRAGRWSRVWHNALGQPVAAMDPAQRITFFDWCRCGDLKSIRDGNGHRTLWKHDVAARVFEKVFADGSVEKYFYDWAGRVSSILTPMNQTRTLGYTVDNNLESIIYPQGGGTASVAFGYGTVYNRLESMVDSTGTTSWTYYPITGSSSLGAGRLASVDGPLSQDTIQYFYDELGRVTSRSVDGRTRSLQFDALGRVENVVNGLGTFGQTYDPVTLRLSTIASPNQLTTQVNEQPLPKDPLLESITHTGPLANLISRFSYQYDAVGNIDRWTQEQVANTPAPGFTWRMGMDDSGQLTSVMTEGQTAALESFSYDDGGNRLNRQVGNQLSTTLYNDLNQIESVSGGGKLRVSGTTDEPAKVNVQGVPASMLSPTHFVAYPQVATGANALSVVATDGSGNTQTNVYQVVVPSTANRTFSYDDNGNLLSDGERVCEWDGLDRMVKVTRGGNATEFVYDGLNRRLQEKVNGTVTRRWVWDGLEIVEERDAAGNLLKEYFPQGEKNASGSYYFTKDHLGSIREVLDASGTVVAAYSYDAWGKRTLVAGQNATEWGFTGHFVHEASGLTLAPFRAYDPETGRWQSRDPIGENGGVNLYGYVANNPVNLWDPLGLKNFVIGDSDIEFQMNLVFSKIDGKDVPAMPFFFEFTSFMGTLETEYADNKTDFYTYIGSNYPELNNRTFSGPELNYLGVGAGFAARGDNRLQMGIMIVLWKNFQYEPRPQWPSNNTFIAAKAGYNAFQRQKENIRNDKKCK